MILVADSGSTKTAWLLAQENDILSFETIGLSPFFINEDGIEDVLKNSPLAAFNTQITSVFFYGTGCSAADRNQILVRGMQRVFSKATIQVDHDLKAAAIALFGNSKGIPCILGTGSNSCIWNGTEILENIPALGYILGDEASGAYFGKEIITAYLYNTLPAEISTYLKQHFEGDKDAIFEAVYKKPFPNRFLGNYAQILSEFRTHDFIQQTILKGFRAFADYHILPYTDYKNYPVSFVGSVACAFEKELRVVAAEKQITIGTIENNPVQKLMQYHLKKD